MAKKSFTEVSNPALQFITPPEETVPITVARTAPEARRRTRESKSRRVQLLLRPSTYEAIRARAEASGESVNEMISQLLDMALREG